MDGLKHVVHMSVLQTTIACMACTDALHPTCKAEISLAEKVVIEGLLALRLGGGPSVCCLRERWLRGRKSALIRV